MTWQRQISAAVLSLVCLTSFAVQAHLTDPVAGARDVVEVEGRLERDLRQLAGRVFADVPRLGALTLGLSFTWGTGDDFVTDQRGDTVVITVPRDLTTPAALAGATERTARLRAAFVHQLGHLIYVAAGGGGDPAFAEVFADALVAIELNDPGAVTRAFAVDGRPASVWSARLRAFDPRRNILSEREWASPEYRLNLVKAELARRADWSRYQRDPRGRAALLDRLLRAAVATSRTDFGPPGAASAARMNAELLKAFGRR